MNDSPQEPIPQTGTTKSEQANIPQTAEPQIQNAPGVWHHRAISVR